MTTAPAKTRIAWTIDPVHSFAEFAVKHMMVETVKGRFNGIQGTLELDLDRPEASTGRLEIDARTVDTNNAQRDEHLRSEDFFAVDRFPTITFDATRIRHLRNDRYAVTGDLTIRDITREVEVETEFEGRIVDAFGYDRVAFTGTTTVNRRDFGLRWNKAIEAGGFVVGDKVKLSVHLGATRAA
jgi:polyisoprenoid-binding protein YceI